MTSFKDLQSKLKRWKTTLRFLLVPRVNVRKVTASSSSTQSWCLLHFQSHASCTSSFIHSHANFYTSADILTFYPLTDQEDGDTCDPCLDMWIKTKQLQQHKPDDLRLQLVPPRQCKSSSLTPDIIMFSPHNWTALRSISTQQHITLWFC